MAMGAEIMKADPEYVLATVKAVRAALVAPPRSKPLGCVI